MGFAEDLIAVVESHGVKLKVILDDCVLAPRGWLIIDSLRLRE